MKIQHLIPILFLAGYAVHVASRRWLIYICRRSGVSAERRKLLEIEGVGFRPGVFIGCSPEGFLPKAATPIS
jgi:hypothetical protein